MLQIVKRESNVGYESVLSDLGLLDNKSIKISEAVSGDSVDGYIIYEFVDDAVKVYDINANGDLMLLDGLVRSALFLAAMSGIEKAEFLQADKTDLLRLRFVTESCNVLEPISEKLGGCEHCKHNG